MLHKTTKDIAARLGVKSRTITTYAKRYGLMPVNAFDGSPMWTAVEEDCLVTHMEQMAVGLRCKTCGQVLPVVETAEATADAD